MYVFIWLSGLDQVWQYQAVFHNCCFRLTGTTLSVLFFPRMLSGGEKKFLFSK